MSEQRKTVAEVAMAELWQLEKENRNMAGQQQNQPQLAPEHVNALQQAGITPAQAQRMTLAQIIALIQALLAAVGPIVAGGGGTGGSVPPS